MTTAIAHSPAHRATNSPSVDATPAGPDEAGAAKRAAHQLHHSSSPVPDGTWRCWRLLRLGLVAKPWGLALRRFWARFWASIQRIGRRGKCTHRAGSQEQFILRSSVNAVNRLANRATAV